MVNTKLFDYERELHSKNQAKTEFSSPKNKSNYGGFNKEAQNNEK